MDVYFAKLVECIYRLVSETREHKQKGQGC